MFSAWENDKREWDYMLLLWLCIDWLHQSWTQVVHAQGVKIFGVHLLCEKVKKRAKEDHNALKLILWSHILVASESGIYLMQSGINLDLTSLLTLVGLSVNTMNMTGFTVIHVIPISSLFQKEDLFDLLWHNSELTICNQLEAVSYFSRLQYGWASIQIIHFTGCYTCNLK